MESLLIFSSSHNTHTELIRLKSKQIHSRKRDSAGTIQRIEIEIKWVSAF